MIASAWTRWSAAACGLSLAALLAGGAVAQSAPAEAVPDPEASAQGDLSLTIYNDSLALVQDVRQIDIANGRSRIEFPDVSATIRPETLSFAAANTTIIEQNFDYDLLTPSKLMEKAVGQTVTLLRTNRRPVPRPANAPGCSRSRAAWSSRSASASRCCAMTGCRCA